MTDTAIAGLPVCTYPGCQSAAPFTTDDGYRCWAHSEGPVVPGETLGPMEAAVAPSEPSFAVDVVAGLAAVVLDHTAIALQGTESAIGDASASLAKATGMTDDLAAGILLATTWLVAAGELTDEQVTEGSALYEAQAEGETAPEPRPPCDFCESTEHTTDEHDTIYPLPGEDSGPDDNDNESELGDDDRWQE